MKRTTLAGHPLHPQLIPLPAGLLPFSFAMDLAHHATGKPGYADAAYYTMVGGVVGGLAAGAAGAMDYLTIPDRSHAKKTANTHALMNIGIMALYGVNVAMRRRDRRPSAAATLLSAVGAAGLVVSQWYGGHLVYEHGMRVKGYDEDEAVTAGRLPGDQALGHAFEHGQQPMTERGPEARPEPGTEPEAPDEESMRGC